MVKSVQTTDNVSFVVFLRFFSNSNKNFFKIKVKKVPTSLAKYIPHPKQC